MSRHGRPYRLRLENTYAERSPINHVDRLSAPVVFFQGAEDRVVPPNQTELMVAALKKRGVPVGYFLFDGEQHGFRNGNLVLVNEIEHG